MILEVWNRKQIELVSFNTRKAEYLKYIVFDCVPRVRSLRVLMAQKLWLLSLCPTAQLNYKRTESKGGFNQALDGGNVYFCISDKQLVRDRNLLL